MIQAKLAPVGVGIQQFGLVRAPRVPEVIAQSITAKARAIQEAERARPELAMTQAEAAEKIAEAEGDAQSAANRAKGEAEANGIRIASLTPQMLELRRLENQRALIEKWNGQLPTVESAGNGSGPLLQLRDSKRQRAKPEVPLAPPGIAPGGATYFLEKANPKNRGRNRRRAFGPSVVTPSN